jgi:hypothetical protein
MNSTTANEHVLTCVWSTAGGVSIANGEIVTCGVITDVCINGPNADCVTGVTAFPCTDPTSTGLIGVENEPGVTMQRPGELHPDPFPPSMATVNESANRKLNRAHIDP